MKTLFRCQGCSRKLGVDDSQAGRVGNCPDCDFVFVVPNKSDPEFVGLRKKRKASAASPVPLGGIGGSVDDFDPGQDEMVREKSKPKKKKRKSKKAEQIEFYKKILIYYFSGLLIILLLSFVVKNLLVVYLALVVVPWVISGIWLMFVGFQEELRVVILSWLFPIFGFYVMFSNWDRYKRPLLLHFFCYFLLALPFLIMLLIWKLL